MFIICLKECNIMLEFIGANWDTITLIVTNVLALLAKSPLKRLQ